MGRDVVPFPPHCYYSSSMHLKMCISCGAIMSVFGFLCCFCAAVLCRQQHAVM